MDAELRNTLRETNKLLRNLYKSQQSGSSSGGSGGTGGGLTQAETTAAVRDAIQTAGDINALVSNTDQLETLSAAIGTNTDQLETLLTSLNGNTDGLEAALTALVGNTDGLELSATTQIARLEQIRDKLIAGPASEATLAAANASLQDILLELRDDIQATETVWYDRLTPTLFYVRVRTASQDTGTVTIAFLNIDGSPATPVIANLVQASATRDFDLTSFFYRATVAGTGYAAGDTIEEVRILDTSTGTITGTVWLNKTQGTVLASPPVFAHLQVDNTLNGIKAALDTLNARDFATQATLAAVLAKLTADPATNTSLAAILAKLVSAPATEGKQDTGNTSLAAILAKLITAPSTEAKQDATITALGAGAKEAKQDVTNTSLANILAKLITAPATEAKQDATVTSLTSILNKLVAAPATEAKQDSQLTRLTEIRDKTNANPVLRTVIGSATVASQVISLTGLSDAKAMVFTSSVPVAGGATAMEVYFEFSRNGQEWVTVPGYDFCDGKASTFGKGFDFGSGSLVSLWAVNLTGFVQMRVTAIAPGAGTTDVVSLSADVYGSAITLPNAQAYDSGIGRAADAAAGADTSGTGVISLFKRLLQRVTLSLNNWTTLLARVPATLTAVPFQDAAAPPSRMVGQETVGSGFSDVGASVIDQVFVQTPFVGAGTSYNQTAGSLNVVAGTSANAEFLARSVRSFRGAMRMRFALTASQRITGNNLSVLLADLIGAAQPYTIVSATQVNVTLPAHGFTARNVGQFVFLAALTGGATHIPGRYAIAAIVDANTVQFTVAGFPVSGSGTCTVFGRNYVRNLINGTVATNALVDTQRNGWAQGDTAVTVNTTASPGTVMLNELTGRDAFFSDSLRASSAAPNFTTRASRYENLPDAATDLFIFIWSFNGTAAPASATTFSLSHLSLENFANLPVFVQGQRVQGTQNAAPVQVVGTPAVALSGTANTVQPGNTANTTPWLVTSRPGTSGGASQARIRSQATTNATLVKASAGNLFALSVYNTSAAARFLKLYNRTSIPTVGTDIPVVTIPIAPGGFRDILLGDAGMLFATGIAYAITAAVADTDATATALDDVTGVLAFA